MHMAVETILPPNERLMRSFLPDTISVLQFLRQIKELPIKTAKKIFHPAVWNAFGMNKEGEYYRACATYGPMYK